MLLSVRFGAKAIPLPQVMAGLFGKTPATEQLIIRDLRLPRAVCALLTGAFLAASGAVMQGVTGNPLASPSILGVNQGASLAMALYMSFRNLPPAGKTPAALIGAGAGVFLVFMLCLRRAGIDPARMLLAGTALGMLLQAATSTVALLTNNSKDLAFWMAGGLTGATWESAAVLAAASPALALVMLLSPKITIISLGDETAISLGERPMRVRGPALALTAVLSGAAASVGGNIGFICLIAPHIARMMVGEDYRRVLPLSAVFGGVLLVYGDLLARLLTSPFELPAGSLTALIGVPMLVYLARKERRT
jgi:iron complex transport system permease protein